MVTDLGTSMQSGSLTALDTQPEDGRPGILLGKDLAGQLGVQVGDTVTLLTPQGTLSPMGVLPRSRIAQVVGIYSLGLLEFDSAYGFGRWRSPAAAGQKARSDQPRSATYDAPPSADAWVSSLGKDTWPRTGATSTGTFSGLAREVQSDHHPDDRGGGALNITPRWCSW